MANCDTCMFLEYDEEFDDYICSAAGAMDEDDVVRLQLTAGKDCRYYRPGDDYTIVHKQN